MVRAQWTWAIILAVAGLGLLLRTARLGTDITWDGVRRHRLLGSDDIPWTAVRGFTTSWQGRSGVWMVTDPTGWGGNLPPEVRRVPSDQHVWDAEAAATAVDRLNRALGVDRPVGPPGAGAYERIGAWTWFLPLASVGLASVPVLLAVAVAGRRMWHWLAAVAAVDLVVVEMAGLSDTGAPQAMVALLVLGIWLGAGAVPLVAWLATRRSRLAGVRS